MYGLESLILFHKESVSVWRWIWLKLASAIYRSGFFCHHPEAQERKAYPLVQSPLTSVSQKVVGPFRGAPSELPYLFTQTKLESALSVNCRSSSGSKCSCTWAHAPSFRGMQPKPVCCLGAGWFGETTPKGAAGSSRCCPWGYKSWEPSFPRTDPSCSPSPPCPSQPLGMGMEDLDSYSISFPCLFSLLEKES